MKHILLLKLMVFVLILAPTDFIRAGLLGDLGPEEIVPAGSTDLDVGTYSVPSYADWNNDNLNDLVIGCGNGKVRVYLNNGTQPHPQFSSYFYAQSNGSDLYSPPSGCLGSFPRVVYWDDDAYKDLLVGQSDGTIKIFRNIGADDNPTFDSGTYLRWGATGSKTNIDVGSRATPFIVDWNNDSKKDLAVGALNGKLHLFLNQGTDPAPDFLTQTFAQAGSGDLTVPQQRSSPVILDLDNDGRKDLLSGNTEGQLLFYSNVGTDEVPTFSAFSLIASDGIPINLDGTPRSRPFVCDWTNDGYLDVLIGAYDGKVHLYQGIPEPYTISLLILGGLMLRRKRKTP